MNRQQRWGVMVLLLIVVPVLVWLVGLAKLHNMPNRNTLEFIAFAFKKTVNFEDWRLIAIYLVSIPVTFFTAKFMGLLQDDGFRGRAYKKFLRGTQMASPEKLADKTRKAKQEQVTIAGIPIPRKVEGLHFLLNGSTGTGKSVTIREMVDGAIKRGDRVIVVDPNADMFSKFARKGDILLNPFDTRTKKWSIYNEIKNSFDYRNVVGSVVPKADSKESEEWNGYARVLLESVMRKSAENSRGTPEMRAVSDVATVKSVKHLKTELAGTDAESLFVEGADKALGSARFVLSSRLPIFKEMPHGHFSIRNELETGSGNFYITWQEQQKASLTPLVSAWIDIFCSSILTLEENPEKKTWLFLDELHSLDNIRSLVDALTKGRKHGLIVVAGLQSIAQLREIYGRDGSQTLLSCFRNLIVLGGSNADSETAKSMSNSIGEHEVLRVNKNKSRGQGTSSRSESERVDRELVVLPSEIMSLPELQGYLKFSGDYPVAKFKTIPKDFDNINAPFVLTEA